MSGKDGCGEGCRTYIDETIAKVFVSIVIITFIIALTYGIVLHVGFYNQEHNLQGNISEKDFPDKNNQSVLNIDLFNSTDKIALKNTVKITSLNETGDYIEIKNYGSEPVNLSGWKVSDRNGAYIFTFPDISLKSGQTVTLYSGADSESKANLKGAIIWTTDDVWDDSGDEAVLYDNSGRKVDKKE